MQSFVSTELRTMLVNKRDFIKILLPSTRQVKLIKLVRARGRVTSIEIAKRLDISLPNATQQLRHLYDMGYLDREDVGDPSGGSLYEYWCDLEC